MIAYDATGAIARVTQLNTVVHSRDSIVYDLAASSDGDAYVLAQTEQYPDQGELVLVKYAIDGAEQWRHRILDYGSSGTQLVLDRVGNPLVLGTLNYQLSSDTDDILVTSFNADGTEFWRYVYDGPAGQADNPLDLGATSDGDIYVSGTSRIGDETLPILFKLDFRGVFVWDRIGVMGSHPMAVAADGSVYLTGRFGYTLAKYSASGELVWLHWIDSPPDCYSIPADMVVGQAGNIVVAGLGCSAGGWQTSIVRRFNSMGQLQWTYEFPSDESTVVIHNVATDLGGNVFIAGTEVDQALPASLIASRISQGGQRQWLARYSLNSGNLYNSRIERAYDWLYVSGTSYAGFSNGSTTILRYDLTGALRGLARYSGPISVGFSPYHFYVSVEGAYAGGVLWRNSTNSDVVTVRYGAPPPACAGSEPCLSADTNADCRVDLLDLAAVLVTFGSTHEDTVSPADGDLNFDGTTSLEDLARVLTAFGCACP